MAVRQFAEWLRSRQGEIDANLKTIDSNVRAVNILDYQTNNLDADLCPCLMIEQTYKSRTWEALDTGFGPTGNLRIGLTIWGLVHGYEDSVLDDMADELESSVADILNCRHETFSTEGWQFYFNETMPMAESSFGFTRFGGAVLRGFTSSIVVDAIVSQPQAGGN